MFKRILKWVGGAIVLLFLVVVGALVNAEMKYKKYDALVLEDPQLEISLQMQNDWVAEGERIARMKGCFDCHGTDLGGKAFIEDPAMGTFAGTNLTKGQGGIGGTYTDQDWVRSIRYGRGPDKKYLQFMPSEEYYHLSDTDLAKLITYLKALPPVDRESTPVKAGTMAKVLSSFGKMPLLFSGKNIDMKVTPPHHVAMSDQAEYGQYLAASCVGCHQPNYAGGPIPGVPPSWPMASNLTSSGNLANWSFDDFKKMGQTGVTPEGKTLNPQFMPWPAMAAMNDTELTALYNFLKSLPPAKQN
ncbi:Fructose dehydrogenase cytochrome subunit precursor [compost metagenome]